MENDTIQARQAANIIEHLKNGQASEAERLCRDALVTSPSSPPLLRLLGHAFLRQNKLDEAEEQFRFALNIAPDFPPLIQDLGAALAARGKFDQAEPLLLKASRLDPSNDAILRKLAEVQAAMGHSADANETFGEYISKDGDREQVVVGVEHLRSGRTDEAIKTLRSVLARSSENVDALRLLASAYRKRGENLSDAEALLRRAVTLAPDFIIAWLDLGALLQDQLRANDSIDCFEQVLKHDPKNPLALSGLAGALAAAGKPDRAVEIFEALQGKGIQNAAMWQTYGHVLKTVGRQQDALQAYRKALDADPDFGEVYWSMANLKVNKLTDDDLEKMLLQLENPELSDLSRVNVSFALGKAYEDRTDYKKAWRHYDEGNRLRRTQTPYDPIEVKETHKEIMETFSEEFFSERASFGCDREDAIFIVGLPRTGSTLIEQILASHSMVEGTAELPYLGKIAASVGKYRLDGVRYPASLKDLRRVDWRGYGLEYLEEASRHRRTDAARFTDKLPNNFAHIGFASLILPNAKFINTRRFPLDSCLGVYKQLFARGQNFSYDQFELAEYYKQYDLLMQHWHAVLPGKILDVHYEDTVMDLEGQVRRILDYCGLPFEPACLDFHKTDRSVQTASSEQVRQPIYSKALGLWREYDADISLWKESLKEVIESLPLRIREAADYTP